MSFRSLLPAAPPTAGTAPRHVHRVPAMPARRTKRMLVRAWVVRSSDGAVNAGERECAEECGDQPEQQGRVAANDSDAGYVVAVGGRYYKLRQRQPSKRSSDSVTSSKLGPSIRRLATTRWLAGTLDEPTA